MTCISQIDDAEALMTQSHVTVSAYAAVIRAAVA